MESNGPLRVHLVPFVHSQSYGGFENHCATLNGTEPSLVPLVTPVKEVKKGPNFFPKWLLCIEPIRLGLDIVLLRLRLGIRLGLGIVLLRLLLGIRLSLGIG